MEKIKKILGQNYDPYKKYINDCFSYIYNEKIENEKIINSDITLETKQKFFNETYDVLSTPPDINQLAELSKIAEVSGHKFEEVLNSTWYDKDGKPLLDPKLRATRAAEALAAYDNKNVSVDEADIKEAIDDAIGDISW